MRHYVIAALLAFAPSIPRPVGACTPYPTDGGLHTLDLAHGTDRTPPSAPTASYSVYEGSPADGGGCGGKPECGGAPATIYIDLSAIDDRTPATEMGYKLAIADGAIGLRFDSTMLHGWSFDLEIIAVDLNGNEGPPVIVTIEN
jgi:hypothetical protein